MFQAITPIRTRALGDAVARTLGSHSAMLLRGHGVNVAEKDVRRACVMTLWMEEAANYQLRAMSAGTPRYFTSEELDTIYPQVGGRRGVDASLGIPQQPGQSLACFGPRLAGMSAGARVYSSSARPKQAASRP